MPEKMVKLLKDVRSYSDVKRVLAEHFAEDEDNAIKKRQAVLATAFMTCPTPRATKVKTSGGEYLMISGVQPGGLGSSRSKKFDIAL